MATLASPSVATVYRTRLDLSGVLAVGLSQSGRTEEIVETLAWAAGCGARTLAITNGGTPLAERPTWPRSPRPGRAGVPATKTFTTQLAALAVLGIGLAATPRRDPPRVRRRQVGRPAGGDAARGALDAANSGAPCPTRSSACSAREATFKPIVSALGRVEGAVVPGAASPPPRRWSSR